MLLSGLMIETATCNPIDVLIKHVTLFSEGNTILVRMNCIYVLLINY